MTPFGLNAIIFALCENSSADIYVLVGFRLEKPILLVVVMLATSQTVLGRENVMSVIFIDSL